MQPLQKPTAKPKYNWSKIVVTACEYFSVDYAALYKRSRKQNVVRVRQICFYLMREHTPMKWSAIAHVFSLDRTTAMYAFDTVLEQWNDYKTDIENILQKLV